MIMIKMILLFLIFIAALAVGILISSKYKNRVKELKEMKKALNILETKMKFTYEPIPEIFNEIEHNVISSISQIFQIAKQEMKHTTAKIAWEKAIFSCNTNMNTEDLEIIKNLGKLLGKTSLEGQVSQIELTNTFLTTQIQKAEKECEKNEKMYKTLGMVTGIALVIILV